MDMKMLIKGPLILIAALVILCMALSAVSHADTAEYPENFIPRPPHGFTLYVADHFNMYYDPSGADNLSAILADADYAYDTTSAFFGPDQYMTTVIIADSHGQYASMLNDPDLPDASLASGWGYGDTGTIAILSPGLIPNFRTVITHELTHIAVRDFLSGYRYDMPDWFFEGLSVYVSDGISPAARSVIEDECRQQRIMSIPLIEELHEHSTDPDTNMTELSDAYTESGMIVEYIGEHYGNDTIRHIITDFGRTGDLDTAFEDVTGKTPDQVADDWYSGLKLELDIRDGVILEQQVYGNVTDQHGKPVPNQTVTFTAMRNDSPVYGKKYVAVSDASGHYEVNVTYGQIGVHAAKPDYNTVDGQIDLQRDQVLRMDIVMNDSAYEQRQAEAEARHRAVDYTVLAAISAAAVIVMLFVYRHANK